MSRFEEHPTQRFNVKRIGVFLLVAVALGASDLIRLGSRYAPITQETIFARYAVVFSALAVLCLIRRTTHFGGLAPTHLAWVGFGLAVTVSGCVAADAESIAIGVWMMIAVPLIFGRALPCVLGRQGIPLLVTALIAAGLPYIWYSLLFYPLEFPYMGVTANPNSMGVIAAGTTTGLIAMVVATLNRKHPWLRVAVTLATLASAVLVIASGSRTSLTAVVVAALVAAGVNYRVLIRKPGRLLAVALVCAIGILAILAIPGGQLTESIESVVSKFNNPRASTLNHRDDIWSMVWNGLSILGHGREYFDFEVGDAAHNSTIEMLGKYGVLAALAVIAAAISTILATFRYYRMNRGREAHALTPALIAVCFWTLSCGEGMMAPLGGAINLTFFLAVGLAISLPRRTDTADRPELLWAQSAGV